MYAKIFLQIFDGSLVQKPEVRFTFMDLLVLADSDGVVDMTHEAIARRTNRPLEVIRETIAELEAPDPFSRTPDEGGARLKRLVTHRNWGWLIVNYERFRRIATDEQRREKTRERVNKFRRKGIDNQEVVETVTPCNAVKRKKRYAEAEAEAYKDNTPLPPKVGLPLETSEENSKPKPDAKPKKKKPEEAPAPYRQFTDEFCRLWKKEHGGARYPFQRKDGPAAAAIWEYVEQDLVAAMEIVQRYFENTTPFFAGHPLTKLASNLSQFAAGESVPDFMKPRMPTPAEIAMMAGEPPLTPGEPKK